MKWKMVQALAHQTDNENKINRKIHKILVTYMKANVKEFIRTKMNSVQDLTRGSVVEVCWYCPSVKKNFA